MNIQSITLIASLILASSLTTTASAAAITDPLPSSTFVSFAGLDWTWVSAITTSRASNIVEAPTFHNGWRYASSSELSTLQGNKSKFFINNTPIHSALYWNSNFTHVDVGDFNRNYICSTISTCLRTHRNSELVYVRDFQPSVNAVPIPAAVWLMGSALLGVLGLSRQKSNNAAV